MNLSQGTSVWIRPIKGMEATFQNFLGGYTEDLSGKPWWEMCSEFCRFNGAKK